jgi:hypothetical protein
MKQKRLYYIVYPANWLVINSSGLIQVIYAPEFLSATGFAELELREQRNAIEAFLNERMIFPKNAVFNLAEATDGGQIIFHYYQVVDEIPCICRSAKGIC